MAKKAKLQSASVGVTEHGNSAVLVTVATDGVLLDRRRVDLTDADLPTHPYHHEGSWAVGRYRDSPWSRDITLDAAIELVKRVEKSAARGARQNLNTLISEIEVPIAKIAIRQCPELPPTIEERIRDNRAQTVADTVMYRQALASAAEKRGWSVFWYDQKTVFDDAASVLGCKDIKLTLSEMGRSVGAPWQAKQKLAAAAALAATGHN